MAGDLRPKLKIANFADSESVPGPALVESLIGFYGNPPSKDEAFAAFLGENLVRQGGIAVDIYHDVDIDPSLNVQFQLIPGGAS